MKAATGDIFNKSLPTVNITLFEYVKTPTAIAIPPNKNNCSFELKTKKLSPRENKSLKAFKQNTSRRN